MRAVRFNSPEFGGIKGWNSIGSKSRPPRPFPPPAIRSGTTPEPGRSDSAQAIIGSCQTVIDNQTGSNAALAPRPVALAPRRSACRVGPGAGRSALLACRRAGLTTELGHSESR